MVAVLTLFAGQRVYRKICAFPIHSDGRGLFRLPVRFAARRRTISGTKPGDGHPFGRVLLFRFPTLSVRPTRVPANRRRQAYK